jgi:hypothetical protein
MKRSTLLTSLVLATSLLIPSAAIAGDGQAPGAKASTRASVNKACGPLPKVDILASDVNTTTSSTSFVTLFGGTRTINVGGTASTCVVVDLSVQGFAPTAATDTLMMVRVLLDGVSSANGEIQMVAESDTWSDAHAYNFVFPSVPPGFHTITLQFRTFFSGDTVHINDYSAIINHR